MTNRDFLRKRRFCHNKRRRCAIIPKPFQKVYFLGHLGFPRAGQPFANTASMHEKERISFSMHSTEARPKAYANTCRENAPLWAHLRLHVVRKVKHWTYFGRTTCSLDATLLLGARRGWCGAFGGRAHSVSRTMFPRRVYASRDGGSIKHPQVGIKWHIVFSLWHSSEKDGTITSPN